MSRRKLLGRFDGMAVKAPETSEYATQHKDTFSITVKDDDGKEVYKNKEEPYTFLQAESLANHLRLKGANMTDDQINFLGEALTGEGTGDAVKALVEEMNSVLQAKAKSAAYAGVFNAHKPVTEETIANSQARMVRDFVRQNSTVSEESAIEVLKQFVPSMKDYTIEEFRANKGRV